MTASHPQLSVVIVNWNGRDHILSCLESIRNAAPGLRAEVTIVDNCSTDCSLDLIRNHFPTVTVIENRANLGFGRGAQTGIDASRAEYVAVVNPDVILSPGSLAVLVRWLEQHPDAAWVGPRVVTTDGLVQSGAFSLFSPLQPLRYIPEIKLLLMFLKRKSSNKGQGAEPRRCERLCGACMVFRTSMLAAIGGIPTTTFMYGEEQLLGAAFRRSGYEVWYEPGSTVFHENGASTKQVWSKDETLFRTRIGLLAAMKETLTWPRFALYDSLFLLATFSQALVGLISKKRGYPCRLALRFAKASLAALIRTPPAGRPR